MRSLLPFLAVGALHLSATAQAPTPDPGQVCVYVDNVPGMNPWMTEAHKDRLGPNWLPWPAKAERCMWD